MLVSTEEFHFRRTFQVFFIIYVGDESRETISSSFFWYFDHFLVFYINFTVLHFYICNNFSFSSLVIILQGKEITWCFIAVGHGKSTSNL